MSPDTIAHVGLGANLGDARAAVLAACAEVAALPGCRALARSSLYRSDPVAASGPPFVNAVLKIATTLDPHALLAALHAIELRHGRERPYRNAPRTLDLDLLLWGDARIDDPALVVPHPRMHLRAFVLLPLVEVSPEVVVPGHGPVQELIHDVLGQVIERLQS